MCLSLSERYMYRAAGRIDTVSLLLKMERYGRTYDECAFDAKSRSED